MAYRLTQIEASFFPAEEAVHVAFEQAGLPESDFRALLRGFVCGAGPRTGYQMAIAAELERHLARGLLSPPDRVRGGTQYSPALAEQADAAVEIPKLGKRIYIEVEFRPNVEKDLVKFQIGHNSGRLLLGILVLAIDRNAINPGYTSMPEYRKFVRLIKELAPVYPLALYGIKGEHVA